MLKTKFSDNACGTQSLKLQVGAETSFQFRGYPQTGGSYLDCWYTFRAQNGTRIRFRIESFGIVTYGEDFYIGVCYIK